MWNFVWALYKLKIEKSILYCSSPMPAVWGSRTYGIILIVYIVPNLYSRTKHAPWSQKRPGAQWIGTLSRPTNRSCQNARNKSNASARRIPLKRQENIKRSRVFSHVRSSLNNVCHGLKKAIERTPIYRDKNETSCAYHWSVMLILF